MSGHKKENPDVRYEKEDINPRSTIWFGVWILVVMVVVAFLMKPLYDLLAAREVATQSPAAYVDDPDPEAIEPPAPRLQVTPERDLAALRAQEDAILGSYAWIDRDGGVARIPIEEAMRIVAERGLPIFPASEGADVDPEEEAKTP
jgi:hypothetical protein